MARLRAGSAVAAVSFAWTDPGGEPTVWIEIDGVATPTELRSGFAVRSGVAGHEVRVGRVDIGYFDAFEAPLLAGRGFTSADLAASADAVGVNRSFVRALLH